MKITHVNGFVLADNDLVAFVTRAEGNAYGAAVELRQRSRLYPVVEDVSLDESVRTIYIHPVSGSVETQADLEAMNLLVRRIFAPSVRAVLLTGTWNGVTYQNRIWFRGNARPSPDGWEIEALAANATWESATLNEEVASPLAVGGNAPAQPVVTMTGGSACTRHRVQVTDQTGHGIGSYLIAVPVAGATTANTIVYHNQLSVPFDVASGHVFVRVGTRVGRVGIVDIYSGTAVTNTGTGGALDSGGLVLDADVASGIFKPAVGDPFEHPLSAALSWHPGKVTRHDNGRAYTFGWDGARIRMTDRESTGVKYLFDDDMDAVVLTSPVGLESIDVPSLTLRSGYRQGRLSEGEAALVPRSLRVIIATADGAAQPATGWRFQDPQTLSSGDAASGLKLLQSTFPGTNNERNHFTQWTWGENTFPAVRTWQVTDHNGYLIATSTTTSKFVENGSTGYRGQIVSPWDFAQYASNYIGASVVHGAPGVYYLDFPAGAYRGAELPSLTMRIEPLDVSLTYLSDDESLNVQRHVGSTAWADALVFETVEVDPVTREPLKGSNSDTITDDPLVGKARAAIWSRARDSEDWVRRWTSALTGEPDQEAVMQDGKPGVVAVLEPGVIALNGDTQVAIGLEPSAADPNQIEWGELDIEDDIEVLTVTGERPALNTASVAAQRIHGDLVNTTTGERLAFVNVLSDATGLEIDTSQVGTERAIQGAGGVGPWYGNIHPSGGARLFDLEPDADNAWTSPVTTTEIAWRDRVAW